MLPKLGMAVSLVEVVATSRLGPGPGGRRSHRPGAVTGGGWYGCGGVSRLSFAENTMLTKSENYFKYSQ